MDQLEQTAQFFDRKVYLTCSIKTTILEGPVVNQICTFSKRVDADLIVMGGVETWRAIGMNNNITEVIRKSRTSVFVVPNGYKYKAINSLTLAINKKVSINDPEIKTLMQLANKVNATVNVLETTKARVLSCLEMGVTAACGSYSFNTNQIESESINEGIQDFINKTDAGLLSFVNREYGLSGRFLNNLIFKSENFGQPIPLLFLHKKEDRFGINRNLN